MQSDLDDHISSLRSQFPVLRNRDVSDTKMIGGMCLTEVFNVIYCGQEKLKPKDQIGTIKIIDEYDQEYCLYKVVEECDLPSIDNNGQLLLSGPVDRSIPGDVAFSVHVDLSGGVYKASIPFLANPSDFLYQEMSIESEDGSGELSVLFGQFAFASEAHLKMEFCPPTNSSNSSISVSADVYGLVDARMSLFQHPMFTSTLFYSRESRKRKLAAGKIPLSRSLVILPTDSKLYIIIELFINDVNISAVVDLHPKPRGHCDTKYLPIGRDEEGEIKVTLTWMGGSMSSYEQAAAKSDIESRAQEIESEL